ncbi:hypothetical protein YC2023_005551 [Brassica napus]
MANATSFFSHHRRSFVEKGALFQQTPPSKAQRRPLGGFFVAVPIYFGISFRNSCVRREKCLLSCNGGELQRSDELKRGGTGVKASIDELHVAACLTFDKSDSHRLVSRGIIVHRLDRDCSGLLVLGRTQTAATLFHCIFLEKTSGASAYVKPLLKVDRFQHAITEHRVIEFSPLGTTSSDGSMNRNDTVLFPLVSQGVLVSSQSQLAIRQKKRFA